MPQDVFGALKLPVPATATALAAGDPLLDSLLGFIKATINAYAQTEWGVLQAPSISNPVVGAFAHDPHNRSINDRDLPALFAWRSGFPLHRWMAQDWYVRESEICVLWVFPDATQEMQRRRDPVVSAVDAIIFTMLRVGSDPAWVVPGDTYPTGNAADTTRSGSSLAHWANTVQLFVEGSTVVQVAAEVYEGAPIHNAYTGLQVKIRALEKYDRDLSRYDLLDGVNGLVTTAPTAAILPGTAGVTPPAGALTMDTFTLRLRFDAITPSAGAAAGDLAVIILGAGFAQGATVSIGGIDRPNLTVVDTNTITTTTPAHAAGAVDVVVTNPGGETATATAAFTFS